jgi:5-oxoprolinase (ATP-hydrolysing)
VAPSGLDNIFPVLETDVYFEGGRRRTPVYLIKDFIAAKGGSLVGPAIIMQDVATVVVEPGCDAVVSALGDVEITVRESIDRNISTEMDPIYLSVFSHRFMGIAEQMGKTLQRTSISVNIKERLDFSCALFDPLGNLVANAPHLPVHLGAMSEAVRYQVKHWGSNLKEGDVLVSNHPQLAGGSHLPDITVITPIFRDGKIVFFVASRGHHADVGGIAPGSMPPLSKSLAEEGAAIIAFKLVENGVFQEEGVSELLLAPGKLPNNSGSRNLTDSISDLKAQVAANRKGAVLVDELVDEYTLPVVLAYMTHIQNCAEESVRVMLRQFSEACRLPEVGTVSAEDFLDDGTRIALSITIDRRAGSAVFDFAGTGEEIFGNLNAPPAVTASAIIYCLRCLLPNTDIPLNQGCLNPIEIKIPKQCILNPSPTAAVVGGNVLTSQRVTDVVLKAFHACAASQGCMNNLTFGDSTMGYYETIAGGAGAGPTWEGCSGVHTHMTNTRITDPEILERRYPVVLRQFALRRGSGGQGMHRGGDGVVRELEFTRPLTVSILSERRALQPYGLHGGGPGARGKNILKIAKPSSHEVVNSDGSKIVDPIASRKRELENDWDRVVNLGGKNTVHVKRGDRLMILSPGGGGYGHLSAATSSQEGEADPWKSIKPPSEDSAAVMSAGSLNQYVLNQES